MARLHILLPTTIAGSSWPSRLDVDMRAPPPLRFVDPIEENQDRDPMLIGHYAPALALARFRPSVKLWHLFVATQLVDVFWALFILGGIEHARVVPGFTASNDLDLWDMPYTHSLVATLLWAGAALFGLNALFHAMPVLFMAMKIAGALFLLWIAYQIFVHAHVPLELGNLEADGNPYTKGILVQLSNPKVVVFFGSIFIAMLPANPPLWLLIALLVIVTLNEVWWYSAVALFFGAGPVRAFYLRAKTWIDRITGIFLGTLGARLLWNATVSK